MKPSLIIFGLGNPTPAYEKTRHNAGWRAIDTLSDAFGEGEFRHMQKFSADIQEGRIVTLPILLVKPLTYMNLCGTSAKKIIDFYTLDAAKSFFAISDDIDLAFGDLRLRKHGGPGTHNGMKSLVEQFGEDFARLRIGIGSAPPQQDLETWVLSQFSQDEEKTFTETLTKIPEMINDFVF